MLTYKRFTAAFLLFAALVAVSQCTIVQPTVSTVDPRLKKICDTLDHLKKDFQRYFNLYKKLIKRFNSQKKFKGNNKCRDELNRMFEILKKLMDLIRRIEEMKDRLQFGSDEAIAILDAWIIEILNMVADLAEIAEAILKCEKNNSRMQTLIATFRVLNRDCLDVAQDNLIAVMEGEVAAGVDATTDDGNMVTIDDDGTVRTTQFPIVWANPIPWFWQKILTLKKLCLRLIRCFIAIRNALLQTFKDSYPYREMQRLCGCLVQLCRSAWKLWQIRLTAMQMSPHELEKALCEWLMELMEIRVKLMEYYNDLLVAVKKLGKENPQAAQKVIEIIQNCMLSIFTELDDCLLKMQCWYIDMVLAGGPQSLGKPPA